MSKRIALVGDSSNHGGNIINSNQDGKFKVGDTVISISASDEKDIST